jgi:O-methyltransferase
MFGNLLKKVLRQRGYDLVPIRRDASGKEVLIKPLDPVGVEVLGDSVFQRSCLEIYDLTVLDTPRLANIWQLSRLTDPAGNMLEVGSYRGGSALHISNANPTRKIFVCDSFEGFNTLDPVLDRVFNKQMFRDTSRQAVENLFVSRGRPAQVIQGYFPESCRNVTLAPLSFVYLDLDTYEGTKNSLDFVADLLMPRSLVLLDDFQRTAFGVDQALSEFLQRRPNWTLFPHFPSQALLVPQTWFAGGA